MVFQFLQNLLPDIPAAFSAFQNIKPALRIGRTCNKIHIPFRHLQKTLVCVR